MTTNNVGKYCTQCSKNVIDFTGFKDIDILKTIKESPGKLCGRFDKTQLNRYLIYTSEKRNSPHLFKILAGLILFSSHDNLTAQQEKRIHIESKLNKDTTALPKNITSTKNSPRDSIANIFQGKIVDANTKEPLEAAFISLKDTNIGTAANIDGTFLLTIPSKFLTDTIFFQVTYVGYQKYEFSISKINIEVINEISLYPSLPPALSTSIVVGGVCAVGVEVKRKWWQRKR